MLAEIVGGVLVYKVLEHWIKERLKERREVNEEVAEYLDRPAPRRTFRDIWDALDFWFNETQGVIYLIGATAVVGFLAVIIKLALWAVGVKDSF